MELLTGFTRSATATNARPSMCGSHATIFRHALVSLSLSHCQESSECSLCAGKSVILSAFAIDTPPGRAHRRVWVVPNTLNGDRETGSERFSGGGSFLRLVVELAAFLQSGKSESDSLSKPLLYHAISLLCLRAGFCHFWLSPKCEEQKIPSSWFR